MNAMREWLGTAGACTNISTNSMAPSPFFRGRLGGGAALSRSRHTRPNLRHQTVIN